VCVNKKIRGTWDNSNPFKDIDWLELVMDWW
jgi:hypothetical protein